MAPPAYLPRESTRSTVTAVPMSTDMYGGSKNIAAPTAPAILSCPSCAGFFMSISIGEFSCVRRIARQPPARAARSNSADLAGTTEHHESASAPLDSNRRRPAKISAKPALGKSELSSTEYAEPSNATSAQCVRVLPMSTQ